VSLLAKVLREIAVANVILATGHISVQEKNPKRVETLV